MVLFALSLGLVALSSVRHVAGVACGGSDKPLSMCCLGNVAPFSTNATAWGGTCGYTPSSPSEIIGDRCYIILDGISTCPSSSLISTCCAGFFPGPAEQCNLGTNCGTPTPTPTSATPPPTSTSLPPLVPAPLPSDWTAYFECQSDTPARIFENAVVARLAANTPAACIHHCAYRGYVFAAVENGDECLCGTGYSLPQLGAAPFPAHCTARCAGNSSLACGGPWALQTYHGPRPQDAFPPGWARLDACAVDTPARVLVGAVTAQMADLTPGRCAFHCEAQGYAYAGVEYGNECHCGTGLRAYEGSWEDYCNMPCSGAKALTCGASWKIQLYRKQ